MYCKSMKTQHITMKVMHITCKFQVETLFNSLSQKEHHDFNEKASKTKWENSKIKEKILDLSGFNEYNIEC